MDCFPVFYQRNKIQNIYFTFENNNVFPIFFISQIRKRNKHFRYNPTGRRKRARSPFSMTGWVIPKKFISFPKLINKKNTGKTWLFSLRKKFILVFRFKK